MLPLALKDLVSLCNMPFVINSHGKDFIRTNFAQSNGQYQVCETDRRVETALSENGRSSVSGPTMSIPTWVVQIESDNQLSGATKAKGKIVQRRVL